MRILGIDPGSVRTGFGVITLREGRLSYLASGCIRVTGASLAEKLRVIFDGVNTLLDQYQADEVAVEQVFMARNPDSALKLGQARGAAVVSAAARGLPVFEYSALQIKQATVGKGHAQKQQVQHMVRVLLNLPASPQADAADALACAICHANTRETLARMRL